MSSTGLNAGRERYRRAALTSAMNLVAQIVQLATGLISVPLALDYVGPEQFGIWMTLSTALAFITFSDFGIGIGMQDRMSRYASRGDYPEARNAFYSAFALVSVIVTLLLVVGHMALPHVDLASLFSLRTPEARAEIGLTAIAVTSVIGLGLLGGLVQRAFNSVQEGFWVAVLQAVARLLSLALLFAVVHLKLGLPAMVFVVGGLASCVILIAGIPILLARHRWLLPSKQAILRSVDLASLKGLFSVGALGLGASVAIYLVNNSIPFLISSKYGASAVADFAVLMKLLAIPGLLLTYLLLPLWPAITEANQKGDGLWIKAAYKKCLVVTFCVSVASSTVILLGATFIIKHWARAGEAVPSQDLVVASTVFMVLGFWNTVTSVILNGLSRFKGQASYGLLFAVGAVVVAALVPVSMPKEYIVWIINAGFFLRCLLMQVEINVGLAKFTQKC